MSPSRDDIADPGPLGMTIVADVEASMACPEERAEHERVAPFEALARLVIMRRAALGLSQRELARRMGTTPSAVSRIESGRHATNARTLARLAQALDARAILGLQYGPPSSPKRELVVI